MLTTIGDAKYQHGRSATRLAGFVERNWHLAQSHILITWQIPLKEDGKEVGKVKLRNKNTWKFTDDLQSDVIFDFLEDEETHDACSAVIGQNKPAMEILWKCSDYASYEMSLNNSVHLLLLLNNY
jgi:hypothetical protein